MLQGSECQEGLGVTPWDPAGLLCTSPGPLVAFTPHWRQAQLCHLGVPFDCLFLQGDTLRWAPPDHEIWVMWLVRAGYVHHPDLPYQSYVIWWTCGHPLGVLEAQNQVKISFLA